MELTPTETPTNTSTGEQAPQALHKKNLYPIVRHIFLVACILASLAIIMFLFYQNGKSIYDNGI